MTRSALMWCGRRSRSPQFGTTARSTWIFASHRVYTFLFPGSGLRYTTFPLHLWTASESSCLVLGSMLQRKIFLPAKSLGNLPRVVFISSFSIGWSAGFACDRDRMRRQKSPSCIYLESFKKAWSIKSARLAKSDNFPDSITFVNYLFISS